MKIKQRLENKELMVYRLLNSRNKLLNEDSTKLARLEKGFKGELIFDERIDRLSKSWLILNDIQLESNETDFQIDSIIVAQKLLLLFEIKNHEGDYYIEDDQWYYMNGTPLQNPMSQLERKELLLQRLLRELGSNIPIESYLVYVNPNFHLYNAPRNPSIIFPTQLNRFFDELNKIPTNISEPHKKLAYKLVSMHKSESRSNIPKYSYEEVRKGIMCSICCSFRLEIKKSIFICKNCEGTENKTTAILRSVDEYHLLFPERKITTINIYEWCKGIVSKKLIQRILSKNFIAKGNAKSTYYDKKEKLY
ncbi:nuclease-related domain-containing protein [Lederbergia citri]|uniref:NERD domain-containing protein n=1 Tax=Lederbergia citri TaxID=2833580 RepID=A0A942TCU9_9BACI|nr:nuclease-related domain-containing protein [Lederbergia citri]MBS4194461.1 NERD domain-containing protein [Lederbergia citri]